MLRVEGATSHGLDPLLGSLVFLVGRVRQDLQHLIISPDATTVIGRCVYLASDTYRIWQLLYDRSAFPKRDEGILVFHWDLMPITVIEKRFEPCPKGSPLTLLIDFPTELHSPDALALHLEEFQMAG